MSYCGTGSENWDVCTDYQTMTFNTSVCNESVAYAGKQTFYFDSCDLVEAVSVKQADGCWRYVLNLAVCVVGKAIEHQSAVYICHIKLLT